MPLKHGDHGGVVLRLLASRKILTMPSIYEDWLFQALGLFALDVLSFAHLADLDKLRASAVAGPAARRRACRNPNHQAVVSEQPDSLAGPKYCAPASHQLRQERSSGSQDDNRGLFVKFQHQFSPRLIYQNGVPLGLQFSGAPKAPIDLWQGWH